MNWNLRVLFFRERLYVCKSKIESLKMVIIDLKIVYINYLKGIDFGIL